MTAFNAGSYLNDSIRSILGQTFADFEFLIVDDASTDGTTDHLRNWEKEDSRIRLICGDQNRGQTVCLNHGLNEARGEWIARQDADDVSAPTRLQRQVERVRLDSKLVLIGTNGWVMDADGKPNGTINVPLSDGAIRWAMPIQNPFIHASVLFRCGLRYNEAFQICQDWELWARVLETGAGANLAERLVFYRHHETSLSHARADRTALECAQIVNRTGEDAVLLEQFRRGLAPNERMRFWKKYGEWLKTSPYRAQASESVALHHLQTAGSLWNRSRGDAMAELWAAAKANPAHVFRFFTDRLGLPTELPANRQV